MLALAILANIWITVTVGELRRSGLSGPLVNPLGEYTWVTNQPTRLKPDPPKTQPPNPAKIMDLHWLLTLNSSFFGIRTANARYESYYPTRGLSGGVHLHSVIKKALYRINLYFTDKVRCRVMLAFATRA